MEQISKIRKCYSCGVTLQSEDPSKEGYVAKEFLDNPNQNFLFCNKCFEIERFRSTSNEPMIDEDFVTVIKEAKENNCLLVYVVNLLTFETTFSKEVINLIQGMKILVVGTKFDLLPNNVKRDEIREYVAHRFRVAGLQITNKDVIVTSQDKENTQEALTRIFELKNNKNVYIIGSTDAGKTALINSFLTIYSNLSNGTISTHEYKNTNLKTMEIPMSRRSSMFETPGISITNSILYGLDARSLKAIHIEKPVNPHKIVLIKNQSLFIGGVAIIELVKGPIAEFTAFFSDKVQLSKNYFTNVENKFISLNKKKALVPSLSKIKSTKDMEIFEIEMQDGDGRYRDIGIAGLGWISMKSMGQKLRFYLPKGVSIYTSRPKVGVK